MPVAKDDPSSACYEFAVSGLGAHRAQRLDPLYAVEGQASGRIFEPAKSTDEIIAHAGNDGLIYIGPDLDKGLDKHPSLKEGYYPVAIYFAKDSRGRIDPDSTHWMMRDENNLWVDKHGDLPVYEENFAGDPALMMRYRALGLDESNLGPKSSAPAHYGRYQLHGFFLVPNEGLDVGIDAYFESIDRKTLENPAEMRTIILNREFEMRAGGIPNVLESIEDPARRTAIRNTIDAVLPSR